MNYKQTNMFIESNQTSTIIDLFNKDVSIQPKLISIASDIRLERPNLFLTIARGSSNYAAQFFSYLVMQELRIASFELPLSLVTVQETKFISASTFSFSFSQSGQSPDLVETAKSLNKFVTKSVCFVNNISSPLAGVADFSFDVEAGEEKSVASTKSCLAMMILAIYFVSKYNNDDNLLAHLNKLSEKLKKQENKNNEITTELLNVFKTSDNAFTVGRGLSLSIAKEAALKLKETCNIAAEGFSSAEVLHGPAQLIGKDFLLIVFACKGDEQQGIIDFALSMQKRKANILIIADKEDCSKLSEKFKYFLEYTNCSSDIIAPILALQKFYQFVAQVSVKKGLNPDKPNYLNKVTKTY